MRDRISSDQYKKVLDARMVISNANRDYSIKLNEALKKSRDIFNNLRKERESKVSKCMDNDLVFIDSLTYEYLPLEFQIDLASSDWLGDPVEKERLSVEAASMLQKLKDEALSDFVEGHFSRDKYSRKGGL